MKESGVKDCRVARAILAGVHRSVEEIATDLRYENLINADAMLWWQFRPVMTTAVLYV